MKAAVAREFGEPLVIEDRPVPGPGPGQITVRMRVNEAIDEVLNGKAKARLVLQP